MKAVVEEIKRLPVNQRPERLLGCEVWRNLDWMPDDKKVIMDVSARPQLQAELVDVFVSQVQGGKNYTDAILGRRVANATYLASHAVDNATGLSFGMDMTPLLKDKDLDPLEFVKTFLLEFQTNVVGLIEAMQ